MKDNVLASLVLTLTLVFLLSATAQAASISASPAEIIVTDMLAGGYYERVVTVGTINPEPLACTLSASGDIAGWVGFTQSEFLLSRDDKVTILAKIKPPSHTPNGEYEGFITVRAAPVSKAGEAGSGASVATAVAIKVRLSVTGDEVVAYSLRGASVQDTEVGELVALTVDIANEGNVMARPRVRIEIIDLIKDKVVKSVDLDTADVLPSRKESISLKVSTEGLPPMKYNLRISLYGPSGEIQEEQLLGFEILPEGVLQAKGILKQVALNKIWVTTDELVKIIGVLENQGDKTITAKLKGEVKLGDAIVATFESDPMEVSVGETVNLTSYFTPKKAGRYSVSALASYEGRITRTHETVLNVLEGERDYRPHIALAVLAVLLAAVFVVKKLKKRRDKLVEDFSKGWGATIGEEDGNE